MSTNPPVPPRRSQAAPSSPLSPGSPSPSDVDRALALRDVMDHVVKTQREITKPTVLRRRRARQIVATVVCIPLLALCVYSWVERPAVIWGAREVSPTTVQEANLRFALFLTGRRVESFRARQGALPPTLAAVGETRAGIRYRAVSDSVFELRIANGDGIIVYRSTDQANAFLGTAPRIIAGAAK